MSTNEDDRWRRIEAEARAIRAREAADRLTARRETEQAQRDRTTDAWAQAERRGTVDLVWGAILLGVAGLFALVIYSKTHGHVVFVSLGLAVPGAFRLLRGLHRKTPAHNTTSGQD